MNVALAFPELPPRLDGIGDYTSQLSQALAESCRVRIYTATRDYTPLDRVTIETAFSLEGWQGILDLTERVCADPPDWLVLQYNPFSYGKWGFSPCLPQALHRIRMRCPSVRIAVMVHEPFVPIENWRTAIMTSWQRWQLWATGRQADVLYVSIEPWVERFASWFPGVPVRHLPVGSNIPLAPGDRDSERRRLGVKEDDLLVGVFGTMHPSRQLPFIRHALEELARAHIEAPLLYVGPHGNKVRQSLKRARVIDAGRQAPDSVSRLFCAMDIYLAPFRKGVSARRGSFLAGLQHGVPTVSTAGFHTDSILREADEAAFLLGSDKDRAGFARRVLKLAENPLLRQRIGRSGQKFFSAHFSWSQIAERLLNDMIRHESAQSVPESQLTSNP